jgi:cobalt-zinc-cadmium efflux system membrane fusion protein
LFEIIDPSDLHVRLTVFENEAANLRAGQKLTFSTNSNPTVKYTASIHLITPNIEENRSTDVHCHFEGTPRNIFPGTFVNADIALNNAKVTAVPEEAIVKWENKLYLFVQASSNQFQLLPIETGVSNKGFVEIKTGLDARKIVIKNAYTLLMKMKNNSEE